MKRYVKIEALFDITDHSATKEKNMYNLVGDSILDIAKLEEVEVSGNVSVVYVTSPGNNYHPASKNLLYLPKQTDNKTDLSKLKAEAFVSVNGTRPTEKWFTKIVKYLTKEGVGYAINPDGTIHVYDQKDIEQMIDVKDSIGWKEIKKALDNGEI